MAIGLFPFAIFSALSFFFRQCAGHVMRNIVDARQPHLETRPTRNHRGAARWYHARGGIVLLPHIQSMLAFSSIPTSQVRPESQPDVLHSFSASPPNLSSAINPGHNIAPKIHIANYPLAPPCFLRVMLLPLRLPSATTIIPSHGGEEASDWLPIRT